MPNPHTIPLSDQLQVSTKPLVNPHDFLKTFAESMASDGKNFTQYFEYFFLHGCVFKTPDILLIGGPCVHRSDAWFVWWCEINPNIPAFGHAFALATAVNLMPYYRPFVGWSRTVNGKKRSRYYSTDRLVSLTHGANKFPVTK